MHKFQKKMKWLGYDVLQVNSKLRKKAPAAPTLRNKPACPNCVDVELERRINVCRSLTLTQRQQFCTPEIELGPY